MGNKKYVAYVGTYTHGSSKGIQVYDVDVENGKLIERSEVKVSNASHTAVSKNKRFLYSIEDEGVAVFARDENGDLTRINSVDIDGMRGCFLATDVDGKYLYVAGYHDGKVTVVHTHRDGRLGSLMDGVFHKGLGSVAERNFRPHVNCVRPTPDNKYLCAVDNEKKTNEPPPCPPPDLTAPRSPGAPSPRSVPLRSPPAPTPLSQGRPPAAALPAPLPPRPSSPSPAANGHFHCVSAAMLPSRAGPAPAPSAAAANRRADVKRPGGTAGPPPPHAPPAAPRVSPLTCGEPGGHLSEGRGLHAQVFLRGGEGGGGGGGRGRG